MTNINRKEVIFLVLFPGQGSREACLSCSGGMYCAGSGNEFPTRECDEGYYCISGSDSPRPEINGTEIGGG